MPANAKHNRFAATLVAELSTSQRNHLRTLLSFETGAESLRSVLGIAKVQQVSNHSHASGLAKLGRTAELFSRTKHVAANLHPEGTRSLEVR